MRDDYAKYTALGAEIIAVARHSQREVDDYWATQNIPFLAAVDPEGTIGARYGQSWKLIKLGLMPSLFVIRKDGTIAYSHYGQGMSDIPSDAEVLKVLEGLR
jgi:peroxiredoxin